MLEQVFRQLPPIYGIRWFNLSILLFTPCIAFCGFLFTTEYNRKTIIFSVLYYLFSLLGITAGYHRLWSHRSYTASLPLQIFLILGGASAVQGSVHWWSRNHRAHHRYTDTDQDPYNSKLGLFWTHIGWIIFRTTPSNKTSSSSGLRAVDISDLRNNNLVMWQHRVYFPLAFLFGFLVPTFIPGIAWGDWLGGFCFSGALRLTLAHHSTFSVNSIAHWLGDAPYDDKHTPRDHFVTAIVTLGEGYHNFHHQFPIDYRNGFRWHHFDPTKWFIGLCRTIGLASQLRVFPSNEIEKSAFTMKLRDLKDFQDRLQWPVPPEQLPVVTWDTFQRESKDRILVLFSGYIHDVTDFVDEHPGGTSILRKASGIDITSSFLGGVYGHSNAAHNLLAMKRIGILNGGVESTLDDHIPSHSFPPPSQILRITEHLKEDCNAETILAHRRPQQLA